MTGDLTRTCSVAPPDLRRVCSLPSDFDYQSQSGIGDACLGQQRAVDAVRFGIDMAQDGYNIFVLGPLGSDRHVLVDHLVEERAQAKGPPFDWCFVNNFANPERPRSLRFPPGLGRQFRDAMQHLIEEIRLAIPATFEGDDYRNQLQAIEKETQEKVDEQWQTLQELAEKDDVAVLQTPTGYVLAPVVDGKVIGDKEFSTLPEDKQQTIQEAIHRLGKELQARVEMMPKIRKEHRERVRALDQETIAHAVSLQLADLKQQYRELPRVASYLDDVQENIIENAQDFRQPETPTLPFLARDSSRLFSQYEVNLVVDNADATSAPVVYEPNPSHPNIIGRIEHRAEMGNLLTDFSMVRSGALLQANGGYLILDALRVLGMPFVWDALKQALLSRQARIETPGESYGFVSTTTLKPEPIPLDIKVILI
jgi:predicted ATP-dependent protease